MATIGSDAMAMNLQCTCGMQTTIPQSILDAPLPANDGDRERVRCPQCLTLYAVSREAVRVDEIMILGEAYRPILLAIKDRHDITSEPSTLAVVLPGDTVEVEQQNQFVIAYAAVNQFVHATSFEAV